MGYYNITFYRALFPYVFDSGVVVTGLTLLGLAAEYATALYQSWISYAFPAPEYNFILESTIKIPTQMTETPT